MHRTRDPNAQNQKPQLAESGTRTRPLVFVVGRMTDLRLAQIESSGHPLPDGLLI